MRDTYFGARLKDENTINVCVFCIQKVILV